MKRIIMHWTAGVYNPSSLDLSHYHFIIDGEGKVHSGKFPVSANSRLVAGKYAAHTRNCNTDSIGVSVAAMAGARDRPFDPGRYPVKSVQVGALVKMVAALCVEYNIPVTRQTVLSHAEVQPTLGIAQSGKWDFSWLPFIVRPIDPVKLGDMLRDRISAQISPPQARKQVAQPAVAKNTQSPWAALVAAVLGLFGKGK